MTPLSEELIDQAITSVKTAGRSCSHSTARENMEYALALLQESWLLERDGEGRKAEEVFETVREALHVIELAFQDKAKPHLLYSHCIWTPKKSAG